MKYYSQRFILSMLGFFGIVNAHLMRVSLSAGILVFVEAPNTGKLLNIFPDFTEKFQWSQETQGLILASFYIGYVIMHIPGCYLVQMFGGKIVLNLGLLFAAICTLITPLAVHYGDSSGLIVMRVVIGLCEGASFPALSRMLSAWIPRKERGILSALVFAGGHIGAILALLICGEVLSRTEGYANIYFIFGAIGITWNILFHFLTAENPQTHRRISSRERKYLNAKIGVLKEQKHFFRIPWSSIVTSGPVWALTVAKIGHDWVYYCLATYMPKYIYDIFALPVDEITRYCCIPYFFLWLCSLASAALGDQLINRKKLSVTQSRKIFTLIGALVPCVGIIGISYAERNKLLVVTCFVIAMGGLGFFFAGAKVNILDLCPNYSAPLMTIVNGIGSTCGIAVPYLAGILTPSASLEEWRLVFWISFGVLLASSIFYLIWGSGEIQPWNNKPQVNRLQKLWQCCRSPEANKASNTRSISDSGSGVHSSSSSVQSSSSSSPISNSSSMRK